jgi:hypothetical protein
MRRGKFVACIVVAGVAVYLCGAAVVAAGPPRRTGALAQPPVVILGARVHGRVAALSFRVRGWRAGARVRIFVDGRYNNFSTNPKTGLALNLRGGAHHVTADLFVRRPSRKSPPRRIRVAASRDPVIAAAGDIACDPADPYFNGGRGAASRCHDAATARVVAGARPTLVLPLGDEQYECGGVSAFARSYALSWGRFRSISRPIPGNHEYHAEGRTTFTPTCDSPTPGEAYFSYFGSVAGPPGGYYSYDVGLWHAIALNSECDFAGGCGPGSPQEQWLRADLAAHPAACTLVYWHRPRWSGTAAGAGNAKFDTFWRNVFAAGADVVLAGHRHVYTRLAPLDASGAPATGGVRQFVVGTGGRSLFGHPYSSIVEAHNHTEFGILLLTLHAGSYEWQFVPEHGGLFTDHGTTPCH